jgi:hypothetical protein
MVDNVTPNTVSQAAPVDGVGAFAGHVERGFKMGGLDLGDVAAHHGQG